MSKEDQRKQTQEKREDKVSHVGLGITYGLLGGMMFAVIFSNALDKTLLWSFGPMVGMAIGILIGSVMDAKDQGKKS